tara:strand:+ start:22 stop:126 length:105 start_codon:yes stop_codon:yes gene_type:complete
MAKVIIMHIFAFLFLNITNGNENGNENRIKNYEL